MPNAQEQIVERPFHLRSSEPMTALLVSLVALVLGSFPSQARLGETPTECSDRYGKPIINKFTKTYEVNTILIEKAIHRAYTFKGWKITAAFLELDGPAVRVEYQKDFYSGGNLQIQDYEIKAMLAGETESGTIWKPVTVNDPLSMNAGVEKFFKANGIPLLVGQHLWQRSDGAIAWLRGTMALRFELPAAREYEAKLKQEKEMKARASVPSF
jgi:hypothetical protein